jgi:hypothetical protein
MTRHDWAGRCQQCAISAGSPEECGSTEHSAIWIDADGHTDGVTVWVCSDCLDQSAKGGPGYMLADTYSARLEMISNLLSERGSWGDESEATEESAQEAAVRPDVYDIDVEDLDNACAGDVAALLRLRSAWGLPALT